MAPKSEDGGIEKRGQGPEPAVVEVQDVIGEGQDDDRGVNVRKRDRNKGARSIMMIAVGRQGHERPSVSIVFHQGAEEGFAWGKDASEVLNDIDPIVIVAEKDK